MALLVNTAAAAAAAASSLSALFFISFIWPAGKYFWDPSSKTRPFRE
jgi:hypothetical protein